MAPSNFDLMQWMDEEVARAFQAATYRRHYSAGQTIYVQGDPGEEMFRLVSGSVRLSVSRSDGREIVHALFEPGDCFGDSSMIDHGPRPQTVDAQTDVVVDVIDLASFNRLSQTYRNFDHAMMNLLTRQMRYACISFEEASLDDIATRVARRILDATRSFGIETSDGTRLQLRLPQADIAHMVGASRQSVNKVLQRFQNETLITIEYGNILVHNMEGIRRVAGEQVSRSGLFPRT